MFKFGLGEGVDITGPGEAENVPSKEPLRASEDDDLGETLVDSERGGQDTAPMTGPTSIEPLDGLCHAGFFPRAAAGAEEEEETEAEAASSPLLPCSGSSDGIGD